MLGPVRDDHYSDRQVMAVLAPYSEDKVDLTLPWADTDDGG